MTGWEITQHIANLFLWYSLINAQTLREIKNIIGFKGIFSLDWNVVSVNKRRWLLKRLSIFGVFKSPKPITGLIIARWNSAARKRSFAAQNKPSNFSLTEFLTDCCVNPQSSHISRSDRRQISQVNTQVAALGAGRCGLQRLVIAIGFSKIVFDWQNTD